MDQIEFFCPFPDWLKNNLSFTSVTNPKTYFLKSKDINALQDVHVYNKNWVKISRKIDSNSHKMFQQLWYFVMIRSSSEAICETAGISDHSSST